GSPGTSVSSNTRLSHNPLVFHVAALGPWTLDWRAAVGVTIGLLLFAALTLFTIAIIRRRTRAASAAATEDKAA
ncbi:MAG TPA: hypothetical protein VFR68_15820, partial [Candidatus Dormibacteraeota bacterium]|nr:hypothetical protein [Candidatus Dormibacteraeota bacterium]